MQISFVLLINFLIFGYISNFPLLEECEILDLSYDYSNETVYWTPSMEPFSLRKYFKGYNSKNYFLQYYHISTPEHSGTHMDSLSHFSVNGTTVDQVPLKNLIGEACVIDVSDKVLKNKDYQMTIDDVEMWEKSNGKLNSKCILIMRTGWETKYANKSEYFGGTNNFSDPNTFHFPGLHPQTAKWLVESKRFKAFGLDTPSVDYAQTNDHGTHRVFSSNNIVGIENLMNLKKLPHRGATAAALPMKVKGGSGAPLRVFAIGWNGPNDPCIRSHS